MALFKRRSAGQRSLTESTDAQPSSGQEEVTTIVADARLGPFDRGEVDSVADYVDLGSLLFRGFPGLQLQLEVDPDRGTVTAASVSFGDSSLQVQAFAAPRSGGLWKLISDEIAASVVSRGGTVEAASGPFGDELLTRVPAPDPQGRPRLAPARFLGADGPRWFLRGVITGPAATDPVSANPVREFFGNIVVARGSDPMPPRELLPIEVPGSTHGEGASQAPEPERDRSTVNPFERGPEITAVR